MKFTPTTQKVVLGVTIELTRDEVTHLSYALADYAGLRKLHTRQLEWPWLDNFRKQLAVAKGDGGVL